MVDRNKPNQSQNQIQNFNVGDRYEVKKIVGQGAYGQVALAIDKTNNTKVAIKKLHKIEDIVDAKRVLREIRILRCLKHDNILELLHVIYDDASCPEDQVFGDVYLITRYLEIDLYKVIKSGQVLTDEHIQYIIYQILKGLKYLHSANIIHRDIKPSNLLATEKCDVRMCDFGLARKIEEEQQTNDTQSQQSQLTEYVVTRYYRAPEIMLSSHEYGFAVDLWSVGCTMAELLNKKILFKAENYIKQIKMIFDILGMPSEDDLKFITNQNAKKFVETLPKKAKVPVKDFIEYENKQALDLLEKLLEINPEKRITAVQALNHPYLSQLHEENDEPTFQGDIDCSFETNPNIKLEELRKLILEEINIYRKNYKETLININQVMEKCEKKKKALDLRAQQAKQ